MSSPQLVPDRTSTVSRLCTQAPLSSRGQWSSPASAHTSLTSDDEGSPAADVADPDDAASLVGISLGPAQSRLTSSKTPTIEKTNALALGLDGAADPVLEDDHATTESSSTGPRIGRPSFDTRFPSAIRPRAPSPWRAKPRIFETAAARQSRPTIIRNALKRPHKVDSRTVSSSLHDSSWSTQFFSALSTIPRSFHFNAPIFSTKSISPRGPKSAPLGAVHGAVRDRRSMDTTAVLNRPNDLGYERSSEGFPRNSRSDDVPSSHAQVMRCRSVGSCLREQQPVLERREVPQLTVTPAHSLRRTASAHSFLTTSALSPVSSLGDDTRFEHIQGQVNSRLQAVKESWQDANIKLPAFRGLPSITALSLDAFKPDFTFARNFGSRSSTPQRSIDGLSSRSRAGSFPKEVDSSDSTKEGFTRTSSAGSHAPQDPFAKACADLTGDVVVLGGYRGSILRSAEPPHRQLWVPIKVGLNVRKVDLEVGLDAEDDEEMHKKIFASGMLTHVGPVSISKRLFTQLHACDNARSGRLRVHDYGYDWRLDPHLLSRQMIEYLELLPCNRPGVPKEERGATIIAHSLGGLITRHVINQRPELVAGVVYAGTPTRCVNILGPMRHGDDVLLSSRILTAQVNFTIRTSFALLPLDGVGFFHPETKEQYLVDFFDPASWEEYRLSPCMARPLPPLPPSSPAGFPGVVSLLAAKLPTRRNSLPGSDAPESIAARRRTNTLGGLNLSHGSKATESAFKGSISAADPTQTNMQSEPINESVATAVTISPERARAYLTRVLANVKRFKQEMEYRPELGDSNAYPPAAVMYGKSVPTVYGCKVADREAIKRPDAYDNLAFASGDGVVLAKAAMLPDGYQIVPGGRVSTNRSHVTLLGDLEGVGKALTAVIAARRDGMGLGLESQGREP